MKNVKMTKTETSILSYATEYHNEHGEFPSADIVAKGLGLNKGGVERVAARLVTIGKLEYGSDLLIVTGATISKDISADEAAWRKHLSTLDLKPEDRSFLNPDPSNDFLAGRASMRVESEQCRVSDWMDIVFAREIADNPRQRMQRFLEEALEWFQAENMTRQDAIALVDYVYGRPKGDPSQEVGGVMVTAYAACSRLGYDLTACFEAEFCRINKPEIIEKIRKKQDAKNSALGISCTGQALTDGEG